MEGLDNLKRFSDILEWPRRVLIVVGLSLSVLVLVSCGDGNEDAGVSEDPTSSVEESVVTVTSEIDQATQEATASATSSQPLFVSPIASPDTGTMVKLTQETEGFIDFINGLKVTRPQSDPVTVAGNEPIRIEGWAVDLPAHGPAASVMVAIVGTDGDGLEIRTEYGQPRPDVAEYLDSDDYLESGYNAEIPPGTLSPGQYTIELRVIADDGSGYYTSTPPMQADILVVDEATPGALANPVSTSASPITSPDTQSTPPGLASRNRGTLLALGHSTNCYTVQ